MSKHYEDNFAKRNKNYLPTKASGASNNDADFRCGEYLLEHKFRKKRTIWINMSWWEKVRKQAIMCNRKPALIFENEECSVVWLFKKDIRLHKGAKFGIIRSSRDKKLRNDNYIDKIIENEFYVLQYKELVVLDLRDFEEIIND